MMFMQVSMKSKPQDCQLHPDTFYLPYINSTNTTAGITSEVGVRLASFNVEL